MERVYNFAAGPSAMPLEVLDTAAREMLCFGGTGMSVMEMSHRSRMYLSIYEETEALLRELLHIPDAYAILMLQGGATLQFAAVALNLMNKSNAADYIDSGNFAHSAFIEAQKYGAVRCAASSRAENYVRIPSWREADFDPNADYFYITTNNTIFGTRFTSLPNTGNVPLVADMSSNILSERYNVRDFGVIFAGAQKNIGSAGMTLVIVRRDLLGRARNDIPKVMDWRNQSECCSMVNTPPTYSIYMANLCLKWLKRQGGVEGIEPVNIEKARLLYDFLDESRLFKGTADKAYRSRMNVTFTAGSAEKDVRFVEEAAKNGLVNLKGHRLTGGIRASIYNAMPIKGVRALVKFMKQFEAKER